MKHQTINHELQVGENNIWVPTIAEMYRPAFELLKKDQITAAIQTAAEIRVSNYGTINSARIQFRVITTTTTWIE